MSAANERAVLSILLRKPDLSATAFSRVPVNAFTGDQAFLAEAIQGLRVARKPVDATTCFDEMRRRGTLSRVGNAYPHEIAGELASPETLTYHLDELAGEQRLRKLAGIGDRMVALTSASDADSAQIAHHSAEALQAVIDNITAEQDISTLTLTEFLAGDDDPYDWVIPGLLERADRLILTGGEGLGKSTLFRQMAIAAAAGVHPFTRQRYEPQRVLYVDLENGVRKMRRALRPLVRTAKALGGDPGENLFIETLPGGFDLRTPEDELWLVSRIVALQPSILVTGSLYKMYSGNPNEAEPAADVMRVIDRCRAAADCAVIIEAHSGKGKDFAGKRNMDPSGTSFWLRWPEFGFGIRPSEDFTKENRIVECVSWRGDREERDWPVRLKAGSLWPWEIAADPEGEWSPSEGHVRSAG